MVLPLDAHVALLVPADPFIDGIELLLDATAATELTVELWSTGKPQNYVPHTVTSVVVPVGKGSEQWVRLLLQWHPENAQNAFIVLKSNPALSVHLSDRPQSGVLSFKHNAARRIP